MNRNTHTNNNYFFPLCISLIFFQLDSTILENTELYNKLLNDGYRHINRKIAETINDLIKLKALC